jgi:hypothetical protein
MTAENFRPATVSDALKMLEDIAFSASDVVFRGHSDPSWRLNSTLSRFIQTNLAEMHLARLEGMLHQFFGNLRSIGTLPEAADSRRGRLEYGRHYGVPSPLIDFTFSPYVALFFAFNDINFRRGQEEEVVVYALDLMQLALAQQRRFKDQAAHSVDSFFAQSAEIFDKMFEHGYPLNVLKFFRYPASWNIRMQRQLGCFIYDVFQHRSYGYRDLEEFSDNIEEVSFKERGIWSCLNRVYFKKHWAGTILARLELMGITATHLLGAEGAAMDVRNSYVYNRKGGLPWDLRLPQEGGL